MLGLAVRWLVLLTTLASLAVDAYRIEGSASESDAFVPFEDGFVGKINEPSNFGRERVNEGAPRSQGFPRQFGDMSMDNRGSQVCPSMVGPLKDNKVSLLCAAAFFFLEVGAAAALFPFLLFCVCLESSFYFNPGPPHCRRSPVAHAVLLHRQRVRLLRSPLRNLLLQHWLRRY